MSGGSYDIYADSFSTINGQDSTGGTFTLFGTGDSIQSASSTAGSFVLRSGFQSQEKGILSFSKSASTVSLGTLSTGSVSTGSVDVTISTDAETGYTLAISEDGNLRSGSDDINDVSDGTVTAGSEEYGIVTSGTDGLLATATPISGSVAVAHTGGAATGRVTTIQFQAAISSGTAAGSYSHAVTFTATVNP